MYVAVGELGVGHDRGRVRVHERRPRSPRAAAPCRPASPSSRTRTPARSRSGPSRSPGSAGGRCASASGRLHQRRGTPRTGSAESCGPAPPRGGTARANAGTSRHRSPSSVPSFRFQCVSADPSARRSARTPSAIARPPVRVDREAVVVARDLDDAGRAGPSRAGSRRDARTSSCTSGRRAPGRAAGARGRSRRSAPCPSRSRAAVDPVRRRRRVAGAVRQEHAVEAPAAHLGGGRLGREHGRLDPRAGEQPQDVPLHAEVVGGHPEDAAALGRRRPDQRRAPRTARRR